MIAPHRWVCNAAPTYPTLPFAWCIDLPLYDPNVHYPSRDHTYQDGHPLVAFFFFSPFRFDTPSCCSLFSFDRSGSVNFGTQCGLFQHLPCLSPWPRVFLVLRPAVLSLILACSTPFVPRHPNFPCQVLLFSVYRESNRLFRPFPS